jgi:acid stress-induced BolA-like protein IbaG/YrbA
MASIPQQVVDAVRNYFLAYVRADDAWLSG